MALPFVLLLATRDSWHKGIKILLGGIALGVCYSRVVLGAHYVSDVLAGIATAMMCFPWVTLLANKILGNLKETSLDFAIKIWAMILVGLLIFLMVE